MLQVGQAAHTKQAHLRSSAWAALFLARRWWEHSQKRVDQREIVTEVLSRRHTESSRASL